MRSVSASWVFLLWVSVWSAAGPAAPPVAAGTETVATPTTARDAEREVSPQVRDVLKRLLDRGGEPLPGYVGGRPFHNREGRLPSGRYREYDVHPKRRGRPRDAERIVIEQRTQKAYYTPDHYRAFIPLN